MKDCQLPSWTRYVCLVVVGVFFYACVDRLLFGTSSIIYAFVIQPLRVPSRPQWHSDVLGKARWLLCGLCIFNTHYDRGTERRSSRPQRGTQQSTKCQRQIRLTASTWDFPNPTAYPLQNLGIIRLALSSLIHGDDFYRPEDTLHESSLLLL